MKRFANITEKLREPACGANDETCCGYYHTTGQVDTVEVDEETEQRLKNDAADLSYGEHLDPEDYGIETHLDNIGWVEFWDEF